MYVWLIGEIDPCATVMFLRGRGPAESPESINFFGVEYFDAVFEGQSFLQIIFAQWAGRRSSSGVCFHKWAGSLRRDRCAVYLWGFCAREAAVWKLRVFKQIVNTN